MALWYKLIARYEKGSTTRFSAKFSLGRGGGSGGDRFRSVVLRMW